MTPLTILWIGCLMAELLVLVGITSNVTWRRMYPRFTAFIAFDLITSLALFAISETHPHLHDSPWTYDIPWRITQGIIVAWLVLLVAESYRRLVPTISLWRFADGFAFPLAAAGTIIVHLAMVRPFRWPASYLEIVWQTSGAVRILLGMILVGIIIDSRARGVIQGGHIKVLCAYLLATGGCNYLATQIPQYVGIILMISTTICYLLWLWCIIRSHESVIPALPESAIPLPPTRWSQSQVL